MFGLVVCVPAARLAGDRGGRNARVARGIFPGSTRRAGAFRYAITAAVRAPGMAHALLCILLSISRAHISRALAHIVAVLLQVALLIAWTYPTFFLNE